MNRVLATAMLRGGGLGGLIGGAISLIGASLWGLAGTLGVLVGVIAGLAALLLPVGVLMLSSRWAPTLVAAAGLSTYSLVVAGVWGLRSWALGVDALSMPALGVGLATTVLGWSLGLMAGVRRARLPVWDPPGS